MWRSISLRNRLNFIFASLFDPAFKKEGWTPVDPGRFAQGLPDFSAIINQFKRAHVEVVTGVMAPPDLQSYMQQAAQLVGHELPAEYKAMSSMEAR